MEIKFYRSESGARAFAKKVKGKFAKNPSAAYHNMCHEAEALGIEVTGDYAVRYPYPLTHFLGGVTIFDPLPSRNKRTNPKKKTEKVEENQNKGTGTKSEKKEIEIEKVEEKQTTTEPKRRGGARAGAGRKGIQDGVERKKRGIYCSEAEFEACKRLIAEMRAGSL